LRKVEIGAWHERLLEVGAGDSWLPANLEADDDREAVVSDVTQQPLASLRADEMILRGRTNMYIAHGRGIEAPRAAQLSFLQVYRRERRPDECSTFQSRAPKIGPDQHSIVQIGMSQINIQKVCMSQIRMSQTRAE
jgi:hypothetical protein